LDRHDSLCGWLADTETKFMIEPVAPRLVVRDAVPADAAAITAIAKIAIPETYKEIIADASVMAAIVEQSYATAALTECITRCSLAEDAHFLVAEQHRQVLGFLHYDSEGARPELHRIYVDPTHKRHGIGSALLSELHRRLPPNSTYILMVVAANQPAVSFYERHGLAVAENVNGVAYMHEQMGVQFEPGAPEVPALILRFTKA
jgi:ribosomal protein S18 acetylase RimI-like enzyme